MKPAMAAMLEKALAEHQAGKHASAERRYRQVLKAHPGDARVLQALGLLCHETGRSAIGLNLLRKSVALDPGAGPAHTNLGLVLRALGQIDEAIACYRKAIEVQPGSAVALHNLGSALLGLGRAAEAEEPFRRAIALAPLQAESHCGLGDVLRATGRPAEAIAHYQDAIRIRPDSADIHNSLGGARFDCDDLDGAMAAFAEALRLDPNHAEAYNNMGGAFFNLGKDEEAILCSRRAVELRPDLTDAHFHLAVALLSAGHYAEGFAEYEWRRRRPDFPRHALPQPEWRGEPLAGKTVLLYGEQGLGDAIHFARYATILAAMGARVILGVQEALVGLLKTVPGVADAVPPGVALPPFDYHLPLVSLPWRVGTQVDTIPATMPYVHAEPAASAAWASRLPAGGGLKVGLVWAGAANNPVDARRSVPLASLAALGAIPGITLVSLQKGPAARQAAPFAMVDVTDELTDFTATAALIDNLDLVITVDTAVAHLAGAMAKPVWILSRLDCDWRWFRAREDSPWYPTARLFRQGERGCWDDVVARVVAELLKSASTQGR